MSTLTERLAERRDHPVPRGVGNLNPVFIAKAEGAVSVFHSTPICF